MILGILIKRAGRKIVTGKGFDTIIIGLPAQPETPAP